MFLCGMLSGFLIRKKTIFHSSLIVGLGVVFSYLISNTNLNDYTLIFHGAMTGFILGGVGGGCILLVRKLKDLKNKEL